MILENTIKQASRLLKNHNIVSYRLDAEIILSEIMGVTREYLMINNCIDVPIKILEKYNHAIKRRIKREPVAYITEKKRILESKFYYKSRNTCTETRNRTLDL